jgi:hypothetical protein
MNWAINDEESGIMKGKKEKWRRGGLSWGITKMGPGRVKSENIIHIL